MDGDMPVTGLFQDFHDTEIVTQRIGFDACSSY